MMNSGRLYSVWLGADTSVCHGRHSPQHIDLSHARVYVGTYTSFSGFGSSCERSGESVRFRKKLDDSRQDPEFNVVCLRFILQAFGFLGGFELSAEGPPLDSFDCAAFSALVCRLRFPLRCNPSPSPLSADVEYRGARD